MQRQVKISKRAADQVRRQALWWEEHRPAAPGAVAEDFEQAVKLLAQQPGIGSPYDGSRISGVRRLYLGRLSYFVYYVADESTLRILAFWGASRERQPVL